MNHELANDLVESILDEQLASRGISGNRLLLDMYMSEDDILALQKGGHVIGGHTHQHIALTKLDTSSEIDNELRVSGDYLRKITNQKEIWFSYPFGRAWAIPKNKDEICVKYGYSLGFSLFPGWNEENCSRYCLNRINHNEADSTLAPLA